MVWKTNKKTGGKFYVKPRSSYKPKKTSYKPKKTSDYQREKNKAERRNMDMLEMKYDF